MSINPCLISVKTVIILLLWSKSEISWDAEKNTRGYLKESFNTNHRDREALQNISNWDGKLTMHHNLHYLNSPQDILKIYPRLKNIQQRRLQYLWNKQLIHQHCIITVETVKTTMNPNPAVLRDSFTTIIYRSQTVRRNQMQTKKLQHELQREL